MDCVEFSVVRIHHIFLYIRAAKFISPHHVVDVRHGEQPSYADTLNPKESAEGINEFERTDEHYDHLLKSQCKAASLRFMLSLWWTVYFINTL